jgi:hypothetical protein
MTGDDIEVAVFVFIGDRIVVPQIIPCGYVLEPIQRGFHLIVILIKELYLPSRVISFVRHARLPPVHPDAVGGLALEPFFYAMVDAEAGAEQDDEHEYAPGHAEAGQKRSQFIHPDGRINFPELIQIDSHSNKPLHASIIHCFG